MNPMLEWVAVKNGIDDSAKTADIGNTLFNKLIDHPEWFDEFADSHPSLTEEQKQMIRGFKNFRRGDFCWLDTLLLS